MQSIFFQVENCFVCIYPEGVLIREGHGDSPEEFWEGDLLSYFDPYYNEYVIYLRPVPSTEGNANIIAEKPDKSIYLQ